MSNQPILESRSVANAKRKIDSAHRKMAEVAHTPDNDNSPFRKAWMDFSGTTTGIYNTSMIRMKRGAVSQFEFDIIVDYINSAINNLVDNYGMKISKKTK